MSKCHNPLCTCYWEGVHDGYIAGYIDRDRHIPPPMPWRAEIAERQKLLAPVIDNLIITSAKPSCGNVICIATGTCTCLKTRSRCGKTICRITGCCTCTTEY